MAPAASPEEIRVDLESLVDTLRAELEASQKRSSALRPEVAAYLFERSLRGHHSALCLAGLSASETGAELRTLWRLMLESVSTRRFGLSSDVWRLSDDRNGPGLAPSGPIRGAFDALADYPDRFFPLLWLDLLPALGGRTNAISAAERLAFITALFNLGEKLDGPLRAAGNRVMERLCRLSGAALDDWRSVLHAALTEAGLVEPPPARPEAFRRFTLVGHLDLSPVDPDFLPDAVAVLGPRGFTVGDPNLCAVAVVLAQAGGLSFVSLENDIPPPAELKAALGPCELRLDGRSLHFTAPGLAPLCLATDLPLLAPRAMAANVAGDVVLVDAASARLLLGRLSA